MDAVLIDSLTSPRRRDELPDVTSETDIKRLFGGDVPGACPERDRVILELLYDSGLRASELNGINLSDFRGKGKKERSIRPGASFGQASSTGWALPA